MTVGLMAGWLTLVACMRITPPSGAAVLQSERLSKSGDGLLDVNQL